MNYFLCLLTTIKNRSHYLWREKGLIINIINCMKVSVIVPVYNVEKYINRCFDSIVKQTYTNIECIFVDDCSPDNCFEILNQLIAQYSGKIDFKMIKLSYNKGLSGARNKGILASTGEYVYLLDSDDEITPQCIETLVNLANKYKGVEIVQGNTKTVPEGEIEWIDFKGRKFPEYVKDNLWIKKQFLKGAHFLFSGWNKLIKKEFLINNNLLFREGIIHEDEYWFFLVIKKLESIAFSEKYCYLYHMTQGSITHSGNDYRSLHSWAIIINEFSSNVDNKLPELQWKYIYVLLGYNMFRINPQSNEKELIPLYQSIIKKNITYAMKSFKFVKCLGLSIFLMPKFIYNSFWGRLATGLLLMF
jgi:glycosyltransferase involved in cell wall biosynthesis